MLWFCDYYWICDLNFITFLHLGEVSDPSLLAGDEKGKSWADGKVIVHSQKLLMNDNRSACACSVGGRLWIGEEGCSWVGSERGMLTRLWQGLDSNTLILHHTAVIVMLMVDQINTLTLMQFSQY